MEPQSEKTVKNLEHLERKRDIFTEKFLRTASKILLDHPEQDIDSLCRTFLPSKTDIIELLKKSKKKSTNSTSNRSRLRAGGSPSCLDSQLIEHLCKDWKIFEEDFDKLNQNIPSSSHKKPDDSKDSSEEVFPVTASNHKKHGCKAKNIDSKFTESIPHKTEETPHTNETTSHNISHIINPGEMTKIFINKSHVDVSRSVTDNPIFDEPIETIYVYRQKNR
ncbi:unnamed protein product [Diamesa tonsa]